MATRVRRLVRVVALPATSGAVIAWLWALGGGTLAVPPFGSWVAVQRWYDAVGPAVATMVLVRMMGLVAAGWLFAVASLELLAFGAPSLGPVGRLADLIAPRSLQRFVHGLAGLSLTAGLAVVAPSAGIPAGSDPGVAVMHLIDAPPLAAAPAPSAPPAAPVPVPVPEPVPVPVAGAARLVGEIAVGPGESFWSISAEVMIEALGRPPSDSEVVGHWKRLIELNRDRLVDPDNPDLLYPGQVLVLPAP